MHIALDTLRIGNLGDLITSEFGLEHARLNSYPNNQMEIIPKIISRLCWLLCQSLLLLGYILYPCACISIHSLNHRARHEPGWSSSREIVLGSCPSLDRSTRLQNEDLYCIRSISNFLGFTSYRSWRRRMNWLQAGCHTPHPPNWIAGIMTFWYGMCPFWSENLGWVQCDQQSLWTGQWGYNHRDPLLGLWIG